MSLARLQHVAARSDLTPIEFMVAVKLAYHENSKTGECFPSIRLLERETGLSHPTVVKAIKGLDTKLGISKTLKLDSKKNPHSHYSFTKEPLRVVKDINRNQEYESGTYKHMVYTVGGEGEGKSKDSPPEEQLVDAMDEHGPDVQADELESPGKKTADTSGTQQRFRPGFSMLKGLPRNSNPIAESYSNGGVFIIAYDPRFSKDIYDIDGCELSPDTIDDIRKDPTGFALEVIAEPDNETTRKALENRLRWIGLDGFVGEVARLAFQTNGGLANCNNLGQILIRRLDYYHALKIATRNFTAEMPDWTLVWDYALSE